MQNNSDIIREFRQCGNRVFINHIRQFNVCRLNDDNYMTRKEFERAKETNSLASYTEKNYSDSVLNHGGFTVVKIVNEQGEEFVGKYNFNKRPFNRKIGLTAALNRAVTMSRK